MNAIHGADHGWLQIIRAEFDEIPGLRLTKAQAQRLWSLDSTTCDTLLKTLVDLRFLTRTRAGMYARIESSH